MSFTPGPWVVTDLGEHEWSVRAKEPKGYFTICRVISFDERLANARIIAAAPDMLKVLTHIKEVVETFAEDGKDVSIHQGGALMEIVNEAIAKATGG